MLRPGAVAWQLGTLVSCVVRPPSLKPCAEWARQGSVAFRRYEPRTCRAGRPLFYIRNPGRATGWKLSLTICGGVQCWVVVVVGKRYSRREKEQHIPASGRTWGSPKKKKKKRKQRRAMPESITPGIPKTRGGRPVRWAGDGGSSAALGQVALCPCGRWRSQRRKR
jgi:hypothetical protein